MIRFYVQILVSAVTKKAVKLVLEVAALHQLPVTLIQAQSVCTTGTRVDAAPLDWPEEAVTELNGKINRLGCATVERLKSRKPKV